MDSMDTEKMKNLAEDRDYITGIYNYCDRWCERCPFTTRCLNYALVDEQFPDPESRDMSNEKFWQNLSESFQSALDLLEEVEREGIDLDALDSEELVEEERLKDELASNHECARNAEAYIGMVDDWFDSITDSSESAEQDPDQQDQLDLHHAGSVGEGDSLEEALEVVRWYQHQIHVKLMRAIRGELEERPEILAEFPKDSDGSAKVALIGIDRSIAAWGEMRNHFPLEDNAILDILLQLAKLRKKAEKAFPNARAFIRPGFDKIDLNS